MASHDWQWNVLPLNCSRLCSLVAPWHLSLEITNFCLSFLLLDLCPALLVLSLQCDTWGRSPGLDDCRLISWAQWSSSDVGKGLAVWGITQRKVILDTHTLTWSCLCINTRKKSQVSQKTGKGQVSETNIRKGHVGEIKASWGHGNYYYIYIFTER